VKARIWYTAHSGLYYYDIRTDSGRLIGSGITNTLEEAQEVSNDRIRLLVM
jgi:sulfite reductase beta subunit-like hemoprotein